MTAPIEIFRPGTHTSMSGEALTFAAADLEASAAAYDPAAHEAPLCVGHPKHDLPAYGWVKTVRFADGALVIEPDQVDPAFAELVKAGRYKKVSAAFFKPDSPSNPKPGTWYLRHVGFLGAQPPSVKGLKPVQFAADQDGVVVFGEPQPAEKPAPPAADRPGRRGLLGQAFALLAAAFADGDEAVIPEPAPPAPQPQPQPEPKPEVTPDMSDAEVKKREAELAAREAAFAEKEKASRKRDNAIFLDGLIAAGKFLPAARDRTLAFMERLDAAEVVAFAEGDDGKKTELDEFKRLLEQTPKLVEFSELAKPETSNAETAAFAAPDGFSVDPTGAQLHAKALDYQRTHPGTDYMAAVKAVGGR